MVKRWVLAVHGRERLLEIDWDLTWTNRASATLDGAPLARWWSFHNFPCVAKTLELEGESIDVVRLMVGFEIDLSRSSGVVLLQPPLPPGPSLSTRLRSHQYLGLLILMLVLALPTIVSLLFLAFWCCR